MEHSCSLKLESDGHRWACPFVILTRVKLFGHSTTTCRLIRKSRPAVREAILSRVKCIVVDEVDRLVDVVSKHAPPREVERRKRHARPIAALLERVLKATPDVQVRAYAASAFTHVVFFATCCIDVATHP